MNVRTQVATLLATGLVPPPLQVKGLPLSKKETVPPLIVLGGLVVTVAVMVAALEGFGGVLVTEVLAGDTAVVVAVAATPEVVTVILQPPSNE